MLYRCTYIDPFSENYDALASFAVAKRNVGDYLPTNYGIRMKRPCPFLICLFI